MSPIAKAGTATTTVYGRQIQAVSAPWSVCGWRLQDAEIPKSAPTVAVLFRQSSSAAIAGSFTAQRCGTLTASTAELSGNAMVSLRVTANAQHLTFMIFPPISKSSSA